MVRFRVLGGLENRITGTDISDRSVKEIALTESGEVLAWVDGSATYATRVSIVGGKISSICTCLYHVACKHAVAVILEYLNCIENDWTMPKAEKNDERLNLTGQYAGGEDNDVNDDDVSQDSFSGKNILHDFLHKQSKTELLKLINGIINQHDEIREEPEYKMSMTAAKSSSLAKTVEREIEKAAAEPGWWSYRENRGYIPDCSRVRVGLQRLLDEGHADEVLRLGEKLFSRGKAQGEQSHDEGDTLEEVAESMKIVFKALRESSLPDAEKMERAVDFRMRDEYDLCYSLEEFWKQNVQQKRLEFSCQPHPGQVRLVEILDSLSEKPIIKYK